MRAKLSYYWYKSQHFDVFFHWIKKERKLWWLFSIGTSSQLDPGKSFLNLFKLGPDHLPRTLPSGPKAPFQERLTSWVVTDLDTDGSDGRRLDEDHFLSHHPIKSSIDEVTHTDNIVSRKDM